MPLHYLFSVALGIKKSLKMSFQRNQWNTEKKYSIQEFKNLWILNLGNLAPSDTKLQIMPDLDTLWNTIVNEVLYTCLEESRHL